jgi:succinoglycan biosynthesis transport protein ExoP
MLDDGGEIILPDVPESEIAETPPAEGEHFIRPYADAIRDRLFYYFELNDMTHKPKLVAVTGISEGAGTSTIASGLATAFAEVEDAKVLLVDMNKNHDEANPIFEGRQSYSLLGALKAGRGVEFKESRENLFLATGAIENGGKTERTIAPRKLFDLMPVLRASEYDYIIFDMPPTGATSPTLAMAGFMDQVLLVLDAQNTNRDVLRRTHSELVQGKAEVSCIFNKTRAHAPRWVQGEV